MWPVSFGLVLKRNGPCEGGKSTSTGTAPKAHRDVHVGDEIRITRANGVKQLVTVTALADRHMPKPEARALYEDRTPPPTPEEAEFQMLLRRAGRPAPTPDKRQRRRLRELKGRG